MSEELKTIELTGYGETYKVYLSITKYLNDETQTAVQFYTTNHEPFMNLSVNLNDPSLKENFFWAKTWSENEPFRQQLLDSGLFRDTGKRKRTGFVEAELWEIVRN